MTRLRAATARQANEEGTTKGRRPNVHSCPLVLKYVVFGEILKGPRIRRISVNDQRARLKFSIKGD